tara:strand:- start:10427 stop:10855 length:429 start_codon:yes stop_codon:yes gene_type:complete
MAATQNPFAQKQKFKFTNKIKGLTPLHDHIIVNEMTFSGRTLNSGIVLLGDDGKTDGIRPRWCQVYAVGPEQQDVKIGQWVLVEHGRWTRGVHVEMEGEELTLRRIDGDAMMMVSDDEPTNMDTVSQAVYGEKKERIDWSQE